MYFIGLLKFKKKVSKEDIVENLRWQLYTKEAQEGIRYHSIYWTLGRYDVVATFEAPNEQEAMKMAMRRGDIFDMETLVAVPGEEARELVNRI